MVSVGLVLYPRFTALDIVGPFQTLVDVPGLDVFFVIHVVLHALFLLHKKNEFKDWISWTIILGAGVFGLADLLL